MTESQFKAIDSKEIRLLTLKDRYQKLNGKFKTTLAILLIILFGGAYAFYKNEQERKKAVTTVLQAQEVTDEKLRVLLGEAILPYMKRVDSLSQVVSLMSHDFGERVQELSPSAVPLKPDTAKIFEQKPLEEK